MHRMAPSSPASSPAREAIRKRMLWLIGSVVLVHGVMIGIYYGLHIAERSMKTQQTYIAVWVVITLAVVVPQMKEIRKYRRQRGA